MKAMMKPISLGSKKKDILIYKYKKFRKSGTGLIVKTY
ncbi:MAG: hypothetical protein OP8BY_0361 [Candidatus Saccharicenans subterraneus]|uniref:Uncharacterized protein n=1 Tax=Candidatus Saccharicenans subterraneus TaxID=2508984 RepID=A0A3E2BL78_9BACT|nr:MAG: hypothetical protein OP8BY_0361 [Candidatus Saccharicenans subterraneum]